MNRARRWILGDVVFASVALGLVGLTYTPLADPLNELSCAVSYRGAQAALSVLGVPHTADAAHRVLSHGSFAVEVTGLCGGVRAIALWAAVMILMAAPRRQKVIHFLLGAAALMLLNIARIAHLFHAGAHRSPSFALYHEWVWPAAIVGVILLYRLVRLLRAAPRKLETFHA